MKHIWIKSSGGPMIFLDATSASVWQGVFGSSSDRPESDYVQACALTDEVDTISRLGSDGLCFGDEPDQFTVVQFPEIIAFVRWRYAENEDALIEIYDYLNDLPFRTENKNFYSRGGLYYLFPAADKLSSTREYSSISLDAGSYLVRTALWRPAPNSTFLVHVMTSLKPNAQGARFRHRARKLFLQ